MKYLAFVLSMPTCGSWNKDWTGKDKFYAVTRKFYKKDDELVEKMLNGFYQYDFGDGLVARISVKQVTSPEAKNIKKNSSGFFGYEWMVNSIIENNEIKLNK